jgi:hypothetical protein
MKLFEAQSASKLLVQTLLARGGAFWSAYECLDEGEKERFFVVANVRPADDDKVILFTATTQVKKRRAHHGSRADVILVPLDPAIYDGVSSQCVLDCEFPIRRNRSAFLKDVDDRKYTPTTSMPESIMQRIVAAVRAARTLSTAEKRLVLGDPESGTGAPQRPVSGPQAI